VLGGYNRRMVRDLMAPFRQMIPAAMARASHLASTVRELEMMTMKTKKKTTAMVTKPMTRMSKLQNCICISS
jgi:hypothetical protein